MMLLRQLCDAYLADIRGTHRPSTLYNHTCFCHKVVRHFGNVPLATLTPDLLRAWKGELLTRYRPSTVHRDLTILQALLRFAVTCEWLPCDPLAQIPSPPRVGAWCGFWRLRNAPASSRSVGRAATRCSTRW